MRNFIVKGFIVFVFLSLFSGCRLGVEYGRKLISSMPYEEQKWNSKDKEIEWKHRPKLARELVNKNLLIGKTRAEIVEMLREENISNSDKSIVKYELEQIYSLNIDPIAIEYLKLTFDKENKVEKAEIEFHKTGDW